MKPEYLKVAEEIRGMNGRGIVRRAINEVAEHTDVSASLILSHRRTKRIVKARHLAIMMAHDEGLSISTISRAMGLDHSSVCYAIKKFRKENHLESTGVGS